MNEPIGRLIATLRSLKPFRLEKISGGIRELKHNNNNRLEKRETTIIDQTKITILIMAPESPLRHVRAIQLLYAIMDIMLPSPGLEVPSSGQSHDLLNKQTNYRKSWHE